MKKEQFLLCIINALAAMGYSLIAPLFPPLCKEKGISNLTCSIIIAIISVAEIVVALYSPLIISKVGRRKIFFICLILQSVSTFIYGFMVSISNPIIFVTIGLINRFIHGFSNSIVNITAYSVTTVINSGVELEKAFGYLEVFFALGETLGPVFTSFFYALSGYSLPFYMVGLITSSGVYIFFKLPVKDDEPIKENSEINQSNDNQSASLFPMMRYSVILLLCFSVMVNMNTLNCAIPTLVNYLIERWNMTIGHASLFFFFQSFGYISGIQVVDKLTSAYGNTITGAMALLLNGFCMLMCGPIGFLPQHYLTILFGFYFSGILHCCVNVPLYVQLSEFTKTIIPDNENKASDLASAFYNLSFYIGEAWEPVLASWITTNFSFKANVYNAAFLNFIFGGIYCNYYRNIISTKIKEIKKDKEECSKEEFLANV
ncbi:MAG: MFS transporter [archaeon]|nr:MFS transporter [archaeon]